MDHATKIPNQFLTATKIPRVQRVLGIRQIVRGWSPFLWQAVSVNYITREKVQVFNITGHKVTGHNSHEQSWQKRNKIQDIPLQKNDKNKEQLTDKTNRICAKKQWRLINADNKER